MVYIMTERVALNGRKLLLLVAGWMRVPSFDSMT